MSLEKIILIACLAALWLFVLAALSRAELNAWRFLWGSAGVFVLLLLLIVTAALCLLSYVGVGDNTRLGVKNINLGLDLAGGVSIVYAFFGTGARETVIQIICAVLYIVLSAFIIFSGARVFQIFPKENSK